MATIRPIKNLGGNALQDWWMTPGNQGNPLFYGDDSGPATDYMRLLQGGNMDGLHDTARRFGYAGSMPVDQSAGGDASVYQPGDPRQELFDWMQSSGYNYGVIPTYNGGQVNAWLDPQGNEIDGTRREFAAPNDKAFWTMAKLAGLVAGGAAGGYFGGAEAGAAGASGASSGAAAFDPVGAYMTTGAAEGSTLASGLTGAGGSAGAVGSGTVAGNLGGLSNWALSSDRLVSPALRAASAAGGVGGSGGYGDIQAGQEQSKADARTKINALFGVGSQANSDGMKALYGKVRDDAFGGMRRQLDEQKTERGRNLKFELFARGLRGGSADIDQNAGLERSYKDGLTQIGARADGIVSNLRSSDEQTRLGLLSGLDSGMDQGTALSSAVRQMRDNSDRAYSDAQGSAIGDMLGSVGQAYAGDQRARGQVRARQWWETQRPAGRSTQPTITRG